jgi:hypothetical protein
LLLTPACFTLWRCTAPITGLGTAQAGAQELTDRTF